MATGKNWSIPFYWGFLIRYCSAPILGIVFSLGYPAFAAVRYDPLQIFGFIVGHLSMLIIAFGLVFPRMMDVFIPVERRGEGEIHFSPNLAVASAELSIGRRLEVGEETDARSDIMDPGSDKRQTGSHGDGFAPVEDELGISEKKQTGPGDRALHDER